MHLLLTILVFFLIFSFLILIHELGHFMMARRHGVKVEEFGFGLPPKLWSKKVGETEYSINAIPFGGFVRLLGEDSHDKKAKTSPKSFSRKTLFQRFQIVFAGVAMNFLLAWVLLSIGFTVGMQPLLVNGDDFLQAVREGRVELNFPDASSQSLSYGSEEVQPSFVDLPQVFVQTAPESTSLLPGDRIVALNGQRIFSGGEFQSIWMKEADEILQITVVRNGVTILVDFLLPHPHRALISRVVSDSPAQLAGLKAGDQVLEVNGQSIWLPEQVLSALSTSATSDVLYKVQREGQILYFTMTKNDQGLVGVFLGTIFSSENQPFSYYDGVALAEVTAIQPVQYPVTQAPLEALSEIKRIGGYTLVSMGDVFGSIFTTGTVPEGVSGPVGIAQMTGVYLQEGFVALMRFTALLSLSLAVLNVFPFPALDGGRLLFLGIELFRGKPLNSKWEGIIHSLGFIFLLMVILLVTFKDIQRLF